MLCKTLFALALLLPVCSFASLPDDIARIRPLLPAGYDVAQIQAALLTGSSATDALDAAKTNYLIRDINGDGVADILVIAEKSPSAVEFETGTPCAVYDASKCNVQYGERTLELFLGNSDGSFTLSFSNNKMVLAGDEGGIFGDPLEGLSVRKNGSISLDVYGGSAWRWSNSDVMQYRNRDLYVVGNDTYEGWNGDGRSNTKSVNFVTGRVVETAQKNGDAPTLSKVTHIAVKPLVRVADYVNSFNN